MPKCKLDRCREEAVPYGKRYCPEHLAAYKAKQKKYAEWQETAPKCDRCGKPLTISRVERKSSICTPCEDVSRIKGVKRQKIDSFRKAETVADLKEWIETYILNNEF